MRRDTPPFITPFAILSVIILIGTSNLVVNHVTHTREGAPARPTRVVNNQNRQPNGQSGLRQPTQNSRNKVSRPDRKVNQNPAKGSSKPSQTTPRQSPSNGNRSADDRRSSGSQSSAGSTQQPSTGSAHSSSTQSTSK